MRSAATLSTVSVESSLGVARVASGARQVGRRLIQALEFRRASEGSIECRRWGPMPRPRPHPAPALISDMSVRLPHVRCLRVPSLQMEFCL